jgi:hypothetical protein
VTGFVFGITVGVLVGGFLTWVRVLRPRRGRRVYTDHNGVLHTHLESVPIRIGIVPDPEPRWEAYTDDDLAADLEGMAWN